MRVEAGVPLAEGEPVLGVSVGLRILLWLSRHHLHRSLFMWARTILKVASHIPWDRVLDAAPALVQRAGELWRNVKNNRKPAVADGSAVPEVFGSGLSESERLRARVALMEERVATLEEQVQLTSDLIKTLAEQQAQLVQRLEMQRTRLLRLMVAVAGSLLAVAGVLSYLLIQ